MNNSKKKSAAKKTATKKTAAKKKSAPKRPSAVKQPAKGKAAAPKKAGRRWSKKVTETSDALDLKSKIFNSKDPHKIAVSLKRSAEKSKRKKGTPLQSAMSMLNFYINRAGKNLSSKEKKPLQEAKQQLHDLFNDKKK